MCPDECLLSGEQRKTWGAASTSPFDPGCVETPFIPQKLQRMGVVHVDVSV